MFQYGNVAVKYQNEKRYKRPVQKRTGLEKENSPKGNAKKRVLPAISLSKGKVLALFTVIIMLATLSLLMARAALLTEKNFERQALEVQLQKLEEANAQLEGEIVELSSPERILSVAKQLGMTMKEDSVRILSRSSERE